jgi:hypothetical protein
MQAVDAVKIPADLASHLKAVIFAEAVATRQATAGTKIFSYEENRFHLKILHIIAYPQRVDLLRTICNVA